VTDSGKPIVPYQGGHPVYSQDEKQSPSEAPVFEMTLFGLGSRVRINGYELPGLRDIKVEQAFGDTPIVTLSFIASEVKGWPSNG
jgi:hypothetical protein